MPWSSLSAAKHYRRPKFSATPVSEPKISQCDRNSPK